MSALERSYVAYLQTINGTKKRISFKQKLSFSLVFLSFIIMWKFHTLALVMLIVGALIICTM